VSSDCLFCKIINKEIPAKIAYESSDVLAFHDIHPQAPTHILFIPKKHISSLNDMDKKDESLLGSLIYQISEFAKKEKISENGYRVVNNMGNHGGQTVFHIHFHFIAGKPLGWPPFPK
jgi:histidine triad (HIT) family protein